MRHINYVLKPATIDNAKAKDKRYDLTTRSHMKSKAFCHWEADVLVLNILGTPGASRDAIGKVKGHQLKVSVTEAPRAGRATDHMVRFLAAEFGVARSEIEVVHGRMNVNKQLRIKAPSLLPVGIDWPPRPAGPP